VPEERILKLIKDQKIEFVYLLFTDINGLTKKVTIPASKVESALKHGVWFDGSSIEGFARICESDMHLKLDTDTFAILPWTEQNGRSAQIICDVYLPSGSAFDGDPRGTLKKIVRKAEDMGLKYQVGPEIEFFLLERDKLPDLMPHDRKGYFDLGVQSRAVKLCQNVMKDMKNFGHVCETYHHEVSHGQHEIGLEYGPAVKIADGIISLKHVLRNQARSEGLKVTFMPKPISGINGSGMHVHQSLSDMSGKNLFYSADDSYNISDLGYHFLAGQIMHAKALASIVAPTVNSYKRLVPGFEAPVYICWGRVNRSALLRIPMVTKSNAKSGARMELRCPDPSSNPYLAFAAMLAAGLDGIEKKLEPPPAVEENVYGFSDEKLEEMNIATLPDNLSSAIDALEEDKLFRNTFGDNLMNHFINAKKQEWREFLMRVTPWEVERYL